jgi:dihydrolipoamide dehydrogenase
LLRTSEVYGLIKHADSFGLSVKEVAYDAKKVVERSRKVANQLSNGVKGLMRKNKITVFDGTAKLAGTDGGQRKLAVTMKDKSSLALNAKNVVLATGARARQLPGLESDGKLVWTYREAMVPPEFPKSLLVIGSGAIGIEFASFYRTMGAEVTVAEILDRILPVEDEEVSAFAKRAFEKQGMKILTSATVSNLKKAADKVTATLTTGGKSQELTVDRMISAVGIVGNVEGIGLEGTKVKVEKAHIVIDQWGFTGEPNVYAIGDVAGPPWLAHKAMHEGVLVVERIAGVKGVHPMNIDNIPGCTYCQPQVASIGLTEAAAKAKGLQVKVGKFPFIGNGKAIALGEPEGFIKTVFDSTTGELLGAHMIGAEVTELIQGYSIAKTLETTEAELMATVFPHPTLSEMMHESVLAAYGRTLHI